MKIKLMLLLQSRKGWQILIPYEDKNVVSTPINILLIGWRMLIPYEDKVNVIVPVNILFIGGGEC